MRIIYVDDDEVNREIFAANFRAKYEIELFSSGEEALVAVERSAPEVIVADQRMPGMSGTDLLERVRSVSPSTLRLMLTAYDDDAVKQHNGTGVCGCIEQHFMKPFDRRALERAMVGDPLTRLEREAREARARADRVAASAAERRATTDEMYRDLMGRLTKGD